MTEVLLRQEQQLAGALHNAVLESFLLHVRIIGEVLLGRGPENNVKPADLLDDTSEWDKTKDSLLPTVASMMQYIHRHLAHLSKDRTYVKMNWNDAAIYSECKDAFEKFIECLEPEKVEYLKKGLKGIE